MDIQQIREWVTKANGDLDKGVERVQVAEVNRGSISLVLGRLLAALDETSVAETLHYTDKLTGNMHGAHENLRGAEAFISTATLGTRDSALLEVNDRLKICTDATKEDLAQRLAAVLRSKVGPAIEVLVDGLQEALSYTAKIEEANANVLGNALEAKELNNDYLERL